MGQTLIHKAGELSDELYVSEPRCESVFLFDRGNLVSLYRRFKFGGPKLLSR
jgi:hypothetical protein